MAMGDLARLDDYEIDPFAAAADRLARKYQGRNIAAGPRAPEGLIEFAQAPGAIMAANPYPAGSEEAEFYEASRRQRMADWVPGAAVATMGTGAFAGVPLRGAEAVLGAGPVRPKMGELAEQPPYTFNQWTTGLPRSWRA
jgi:hypothetical protein